MRWDVGEFARKNLPSVVAHGILPLGDPKGVRVLDMPIKMPGTAFRLPDQIEPFRLMVDAVADHESRFASPPLDALHVYITVDQKTVKQGATGRRAGAHSDGYIDDGDRQIDIIAENASLIARETGVVTHTYIWYDRLPTEFFTLPFPLEDPSDDGSLGTFDEIADSAEPGEILTYPERALLHLTPYVVHRCAVADRDVYRTFVKMSVSDRKFTREGNTRNPLFDYDWKMDKRSPAKRNTPWKT